MIHNSVVTVYNSIVPPRSRSIGKALALATALFAVSVTPPRSDASTLILADLKGPLDGLSSTAADFQAYDANVDAGATVTDITSVGGVTVIGDFTLTTSGGGGPFNTANGGVTDDVPILDGYQFVFGGTRNFSIDGVSSVAGELLTLTLFGAGDNPAVGASFTVTYDGVTFPSQETDAGSSSPIATFNFLATAADQISVVWSRVGDAGAAGFNGFSLTSTEVPEPMAAATMCLLLTVGLAIARRK